MATLAYRVHPWCVIMNLNYPKYVIYCGSCSHLTVVLFAKMLYKSSTNSRNHSFQLFEKRLFLILYKQTISGAIASRILTYINRQIVWTCRADLYSINSIVFVLWCSRLLYNATICKNSLNMETYRSTMSVLFGCGRKTGQCEGNRKMSWSLVMVRFARLAMQKVLFVKQVLKSGLTL